MQFHVIQEKYKSVECVPQTELPDLRGTFYIYLIEQLQPLPYVFRMNGAQTILENKIGPSSKIFLGLFDCCGALVQVLSS